MTSQAVTFAVLLPALLVAHNVADHWVQTGHQAATKGLPGWPGRWACAKHVATYTAVTAATVAVLWASFHLNISVWGFLAGQLVSAATHYWADRRTTLRWLADLLEHRMGKGWFYRLGQPREVTAWTEPINGEEHVVMLEIHGDDPPGWDNPSLGTGAYALDQAWHGGWLGVAAFVTALV
jgi:hypothetical protein